MSSSDASQRYGEDQSVLAMMGAHINAFAPFVTVRIPVELADLAAAAWQRDELDDPVADPMRNGWFVIGLRPWR